MPSTTVLVRYWAAARAATGSDSETVEVAGGDTGGTGGDTGVAGATVGDVLDAVLARHTGLARVLAVASVLVDGRVADRESAVAAGAVIEVLPPFAGG